MNIEQVPTPSSASPLGSRSVVVRQRRRAVIGTLVVFGSVALVGCSTAVTSGSAGDGASAAAILAPTTTPAPTTTEAPTTSAPTTTEATLPPETTEATTTLAPTTTLPANLIAVAPLDEPLRAVGGGSGGDTARVQLRLLELGFWLSGADGGYGLTTKQAVMAFQKYMALDASGKVDQATADALSAMTTRPVARANSGTLIEVDKSKQLLFFVIDGRTDWILNTSTGNGEEYTEEDKNTPGEADHRRARSLPTGCTRSTVNAPRAGGRATSARSTDRSTSSVVSPCTARTASRTTRPRTAACASAFRRWTGSGRAASCRCARRSGCTAAEPRRTHRPIVRNPSPSGKLRRCCRPSEPIRPWADPHVVSLGRLDMRPPTVGLDSVERARSTDHASDWRRSLDGRWDFRLFDTPRRGDSRRDRAPARGSLVDEGECAGQLDAAGCRRPSAVHERADAVRWPATATSGQESDGRLSTPGDRAEAVERSPGRAPRRRSRERACGLRQRSVRGVRHRQPTGERVRRDRLRASRAERCGHRRDPLECAQLRRGPGPVVDGRAAPRGVPRGEATRQSGLVGLRRRAARHDRHPRGECDHRRSAVAEPPDGRCASGSRRCGVAGSPDR